MVMSFSSKNATSVSTLPSVGSPAIILYNATDGNYYGWNGNISSWVSLSGGSGGSGINLTYDANANGIVDNSERLGNNLPSYYLNRLNHTGTQNSNSIADFNSAVSNVININNVLNVKSNNLNTNDFSSIKNACDSITTNSASNRFIIQVYPGTYIEDNFVLKPYCYLQGVGKPIIQAIDPTDTLINMSDNSGILDIEITGANNLIGIAIAYAGNGTGTAIIKNCIFGNNYTQIAINGTSGKTEIDIENCYVNNAFNFTKGFVISNTSGIETNVNIENLFIEDNSAPYPNSIFNIFGQNTNLSITNSKIISGNNGSAFILQDGANLEISNCYIKGFDSAIYNINSGLPCSINIYSTKIENTANYDLKIEHNSTVGNFTGILDKTKIINTSNLFKVFIATENSSQFDFLNDLNFNSNDLINVGNINNIPAQLATQTTSGFLSASDKAKIDNFSSSGNDAKYTHTQIVPSTTWNVQHMLGKKPAVRVVNNSEETINTAVLDIDDNNLQIISGIAITGKVYCN